MRALPLCSLSKDLIHNRIFFSKPWMKHNFTTPERKTKKSVLFVWTHILYLVYQALLESMYGKALSVSEPLVSVQDHTRRMAWGWLSETRTVANVSTDVSIWISISDRDEWSPWQPGLICPQLETGGSLNPGFRLLTKDTMCVTRSQTHSLKCTFIHLE